MSLRDQHSYSVILGVFHNAGYQQTVTLADVWGTGLGGVRTTSGSAALT